MEIVCYAVGVIFLGVGLTVALTTFQDAWKANEHVRWLLWGGLSAACALVGIVAGGLPMAYKADAESSAPKSGDDAVEKVRVVLEEQTAQQMRPYVGVSYVKETMEIGKPVGIHIKFKNTGKSPAYDVESRVSFQKIEGGARIAREYDGQEFNNPSVGEVNPGNEVEAIRHGHIWTMDELMEVATDRSHKIVAHGLVRYKSNYIPTGIAETPFCYEFDPDLGSMVVCRKDTLSRELHKSNSNVRPWVTIKSVRVEYGTVKAGQRPSVLVEIENGGALPATDVRTFGIVGLAEETSKVMSLASFPLGYVRSLRAQRPLAAGVVLGVGAPFTLPLTLADPLTQTDVAGVILGRGRFLLSYGFVEYSTPNGGLFRTTFGFRTKGKYDALGPVNEWNTVE